MTSKLPQLNGLTCSCPKGHALRGKSRMWLNHACYVAGQQAMSAKPAPKPAYHSHDGRKSHPADQRHRS